ncbi:MAG: efflux RND transporter periplasmic adaptor subunit [Flavobacteriaceae bacterium]|jgi:HlyD family secretion protein|nr:efflux RND transporter periplasmic adaptor subunit [Flavobacteriaceae bacterium]
MKKGLKILLIVLFIGVVLAAFYYMYATSTKDNVNYETTEVAIRDISTKAVATGAVKPREVIEIKPNISGVISEIHVVEGETVEEGALIATLRVIPNVQSLNAAQQQINSAQITLNNEKIQYNRTKSLYDQGVVPKQEYDNALATYQMAQQNLKAAQSDYKIAQTGIAPGLEQYATIQIRATISGMILSIPVEIGNTVQEINNFSVGTTIATMADVNQMIFEGNVDEADVGKLKEGMRLSVMIGALPDERFEGVLNFISPSGVETNGIVQFEIKADVNLKEDIFLRANYSANAEVILSEAKNVVTLETAHIQYDDKGQAYVEVLKPGTEKYDQPVFQKKLLETGISDGVHTEIKSGLKQGEQVKIFNTDLESMGHGGPRRG